MKFVYSLKKEFEFEKELVHLKKRTSPDRSENPFLKTFFGFSKKIVTDSWK
jgi:hypothetical protein